MKWGVRRYQNKDGSYTELGRKRYGHKSAASTQSKALQAIENGAKDYKTPLKKIEAVTGDCFPFQGGKEAYPKFKNDDERKKRMREAADLGMQALGKMRGYNDDEWINEMLGTNEGRSWFLFEDQTTGCGMVADLINQGYTAKQVGKMIDVVNENYWDTSLDTKPLDSLTDRRTAVATFEIINGNWNNALKGLAEYCEKEKNSKK